jgi:hypothetical protein
VVASRREERLGRFAYLGSVGYSLAYSLMLAWDMEAVQEVEVLFALCLG